MRTAGWSVRELEEAMMDDMDLDAIERAIADMTRLLPAWFSDRMMTDDWSFGLLLMTGRVLCISHIDGITQAADGSLWLDVEMMTEAPLDMPGWVLPVFAPTSRLRASIQAAHVVAAFELADT